MKRIFLILALLCWTPGLLLDVAPAIAFNRVWEGTIDDNWHDPLNWEGDTLPGSGDVAHLDGVLNNDCTIDADIDVQGIQIDDTYTGTLDFDGGGGDPPRVDVGTSGIIFGTAVTATLDRAYIVVTDGDFNYVNCGSFDDGTSTLEMKGTGNLSTSPAELYNLTIFLDAITTVPTTSSSQCKVAHSLIVNGTINIVLDSLSPQTTCTVAVGSAGSITGGGTLYFERPQNGGGLTSFTSGASISIDRVYIEGPFSTATFVSATWDLGTTNLFRVRNTLASTRTWAPFGTQTFNCIFQAQNTDGGGTLQIDGTNDPSWVFTKNVMWNETAGTLEWRNKGTGTITFSGTSAQNVDLGEQTVEDIEVDKSAETLTLSGGWTADSFTLSDGSVDFEKSGETVALVTTGNFTISPGATLGTGGDGLDSADITVGGNFKATGSSATDLDMSGAAWSLDVTGGAHCRWVNVTNCDASGGSKVYAQRSVDGGSNQGFLFLVRPRHWPMRLRLLPPRRRALFRGVGAN